jgi:hypothetical protein
MFFFLFGAIFRNKIKFFYVNKKLFYKKYFISLKLKNLQEEEKRTFFGYNTHILDSHKIFQKNFKNFL